jgi:hypothetical protein
MYWWPKCHLYWHTYCRQKKTLLLALPLYIACFGKHVEYNNGADKILLWLTPTRVSILMLCTTMGWIPQKNKFCLFRVNSYTESRQTNVKHIEEKSERLSHDFNSIVAVRSHTLKHFNLYTSNTLWCKNIVQGASKMFGQTSRVLHIKDPSSNEHMSRNEWFLF